MSHYNIYFAPRHYAVGKLARAAHYRAINAIVKNRGACNIIA
jgi:hypothetical protein